MTYGGGSSDSGTIGSSRLREGDVVAGKFRIERVLGAGGMGVVVAATHLQLDEPVALKFLHEHAATDPEALARFTREAKAAAKLKSEHVARVIDFGVTDDGTPYIVMEFLQGQDLAGVLRSRGALEVAAAAEYIIQACEGLAEAHARGIVHRDIKPENLFLVDRAQGWQAIKILDFGISKLSAAPGLAASNIATRSIMGSPCYMSPEQLRSTASVDHRTDIWSLGATLFELLAGRTAYDSAQTLPELIAAILERPAPRLPETLQDVPAELADIVDRCMAKDREQRFACTADLAVALMPFAPKRARSAVERAVAVSQSAGFSSQDMEVVSRSYNPAPRATPPPGFVAPTLLSGVPPVRSFTPPVTVLHDGRPLGESGPVVASGLAISTKRAHRSATPWVVLGVGVALGALAIVVTLVRGRPPTSPATTSTAQAVIAPSAASLPSASVSPASSALSANPPRTMQAEAGASQGPSASPSPTASHTAARSPAASAAHPPPVAGNNPRANPDRDLDIRMQR